MPGAVELWDTAAQKVVRTVKLGRLPLAYAHAVSPDGRRLVLAHLPTHDIRAAFNTRDPRELPQPRLSVIDLKDEGTPVRTLIAPHGHVTALAFAPDGRTLALGGTGAVHLFDLNTN